MSVRPRGVRIVFQRYAVLSPSGFGGLPAPSFQPLLNGRNQEERPLNSVQNQTSASSTAKWAAQRPFSKSLSRGERSRLYCSIASATVCLVRLFFSSKVAIGSPLTKRQTSSEFCVSSFEYRSCRVTLKRLRAKSSFASSLSGDG